jgi:hypothetical protein
MKQDGENANFFYSDCRNNFRIFVSKQLCGREMENSLRPHELSATREVVGVPPVSHVVLDLCAHVPGFKRKRLETTTKRT